MSTSARWLAIFAAGGPALLLANGVTAQEQRPGLTAQIVIENAQRVYGPPPEKEPECAAQQGDEIVVCAQEQEQSQFRVPSTSQSDPLSPEALNDGLPRAPDVSGPGIFHGPATIGGLCVPGLQKCPPPPAIIVDFTQLPEAPPGSDADRVGRGLAPIGNETGTAPGLPNLQAVQATPEN